MIFEVHFGLSSSLLLYLVHLKSELTNLSSIFISEICNASYSCITVELFI